jgi:tetratricopeptide (TPR) repeat protein
MTPLGPPDRRFLEAAEGWLELGNPAEAHAELERIAPNQRAHPEVLMVRWTLSADAKQWENCLDLADAILGAIPDQEVGWVFRSFALHELKRTQEAFDQLRPAADTFPGVWTIPYNLACYAAQLGQLQDSKAWLAKAMALDEKVVRRAAEDDPDLKPLWDSVKKGSEPGPQDPGEDSR